MVDSVDDDLGEACPADALTIERAQEVLHKFNEACRAGLFTAEEEKVLRMRYGLIVSPGEPVGGRNMTLAAAVAAGPDIHAIERRTLERMFRDSEGGPDAITTAAIGERHRGIPMDADLN